MSRPNLVLQLSVLQGLNQIRRNIGRLSSSYLDVENLTQTTVEIPSLGSFSIPAFRTLVLKTNGRLNMSLVNGPQTFTSQVNQLLIMDSGADSLELTNMNAEPVQAIIVRAE